LVAVRCHGALSLWLASSMPGLATSATGKLIRKAQHVNGYIVVAAGIAAAPVANGEDRAYTAGTKEVGWKK